MKDNFNKLTAATLAILSIVTIALALLTSGNSLHVRSVDLTGYDSKATDTTDHQIRVIFNRPLPRSTATDVVNFNPALKFTANWSGNTLIIVPQQNLLSATEYTLTVSSKLADIYNTNLGSDFTYKFKTPSLSFTYLNKSIDSKADKIITTNIDNSNPQVLYSNSGIREFSRNKDYLAVARDASDTTSELILINLSNKSQQVIPFSTFKIIHMQISPTTDQIAMLTQASNAEIIFTQPHSVMIYDIANKTTRTITTPAPNPVQLLFAPDASAVLVKDNETTFYYLVDVNNPQNSNELGRHLSSGGFKADGSQIIFLDFDPFATTNQYSFSIYTAGAATKSLSLNEDFMVDPTLAHNSNDIWYAEKYADLEGSRGIFRIATLTGGIEPRKIVVSSNSSSLELPIMSSDDRYVLLESYFPGDLVDYQHQREYGAFQDKPNQAKLMIYDTTTNQLIDHNIVGNSAQWDN